MAFDSLRCAIGALGTEPGRMLRAQTDDFGDAKIMYSDRRGKDCR